MSRATILSDRRSRPRRGLLALAGLFLCACRSSEVPPTQSARTPGPELAPRELSQLVLRDHNGCVVEDGRRVLCWGLDVGEPETADDERVARVIDLGQGAAQPSIRALSLDHRDVCATFDDDQRRCLRLGDLDAKPTSEAAPDEIVPMTDGYDARRCIPREDTLACGDPTSPRVIDLTADTKNEHVCGVLKHGDIWCWHRALNWHASLGGIAGAARVFGEETCVRTLAGEVWCSRLSNILHPEVGPRWSGLPKFERLPSESGEPILDIARTSGHLCALERDGDVWCRGRNDGGQLGAGDSEPHAGEVAVSLPGPARELEVERTYSCAIVEDGVWCWGEHATRTREVATLVLEARTLHLSHNLSCAKDYTGQLLCWGERGMSPLRQGNVRDADPRPVWSSRSPVDDYVAEIGPRGALLSGDELVYGRDLLARDGLPNDRADVRWRRRGIVSFVLSGSALCTLDAARELECWVPGWEDGEITDHLGLTHRVLTRAPVTDAYADIHQVCAVARGEVACAPTDPEKGRSWREIPGIAGAVMVAGVKPTCALVEDGGVQCWHGSHEPEGYVFVTPPFALDVDDAVELVVGWFGVCVRTRAGAVRCGRAAEGPALATEIAAGAVELDAGMDHWCARVDADADGSSEAVECHGSNVEGQLGVLGAHVMLTPMAIALPPQAIATPYQAKRAQRVADDPLEQLVSL